LPLKQGLEVNSENKPKKIIGDLMAKILETLPSKINKDTLLQVISAFEDNVSEKQILVYFNDSNLQKEMSRYNLSGEIKDTRHDYLMVVNTNIAGQKSDRKMEEKIEHASEINQQGKIINTVKITRTHTGLKNEALVGVRNVDWLRVYVPAGSELISADGFRSPDPEFLQERPDTAWIKNPSLENELAAITDKTSGTKIYHENNKTVFANWLMVDPGETATVILKYKLAFNIYAASPKNSWLDKINKFLNPDSRPLIPYSLLVQKQAGAKASDFSSSLSLPADLSVFWNYPEEYKENGSWQILDSINSDKYYAGLLKDNKK